MPKKDREETRLKVCRICSKEFSVKGWYSGSFCSLGCANSSARTRRSLHCAQCRKRIERVPAVLKRTIRGRSFCSVQCSSEFFRGSLHPQWKGEKLNFTCLYCKKTKRLFARKTRKFCSIECSRAYQRGHRHAAWRGNRRQDRGADWYSVAASIRDRDGHICQVCGKPERKGQKLDVDHIVPFRLVKANEPINLLSVCKAPCHVTKTLTAESKFLKGDMLSFQRLLNQQGWPMDRVEAAIQHWRDV